jgi:acetyl-CoA carboxylase carboxyl transferase subunit beta
MSPAAEELVDPGMFSVHEDGLATTDPIRFPGYAGTIEKASASSGSDESVTAGSALIGGHPIELATFDFAFLGGSMGEVAGERLARAMERAATRGVPFVLRTSTGGARMQEGMRSLVQMPKAVVARRRLAQAHCPFIAVLGHPTTGGVLAGLAALADILVAEADATVGFAGPRLVEQVTGESPSGRSHTAATASAHGLIDDVIPPGDVRTYLIAALGVLAEDDPRPVDEEPSGQTEGHPDPWETVQVARAEDRPTGEEITRGLTDDLIILRGDRAGSDDGALSTALVRVLGRKAIVLALDRRLSPGPGAFRKARRCLRFAENLGVPVITFIDTRGADPSPDSENAGIAWAIARTTEAMLTTKVPTVAVITGEGGSGGALALASADRVLAYEQSIFSVIGPELAATILWRDAGRAAEAARVLHLTGPDLYDLGIADALIPEPLEPARLASTLAYHLDDLASLSTSDLLEHRMKRWRNDGDRQTST